MSKKVGAIQELEGIENTIWAHKFEFQDITENERLSTIESFEEKKKLVEAKLKAVEIKDKLK